MRVLFGDFVFDGDGRRLTRRGMTVRLEPKAFELLALLLERRPAAVSKSEIRDRLWPRTFVSESSLTTLARQLREALGSERLRTVRGFGYAFEGEGGAEAPRSPALPQRFLAWSERMLPLHEGTNVVGRDPEVELLVDAPGVSRRHAAVHVRDGSVEIEDLGSKNGTFLHGSRLAGRSPLRDGDELWLGPRTLLVYRCPAPPAATQTESL